MTDVNLFKEYQLLNRLDFNAWRRLIKRALLHTAALESLRERKLSQRESIFWPGDPRDISDCVNQVSEAWVPLKYVRDPGDQSKEDRLYKETGLWTGSYSGKATELNLYVVHLEGEFPWFYQKMIAEKDEDVRPWQKWAYEFNTKELSCYKVGVTKHDDISKRFGKELKRVIFMRKCSLGVALNAELFFLLKLLLRYPKSAGRTDYGLKYHGRKQGLSLDYKGASETFLFWKNEEHLVRIANETVDAISAIYEVGGVSQLKLHAEVNEILMKVVLGCSWASQINHPCFDEMYGWAYTNSWLGIGVRRSREGSTPVPERLEELLDWSIKHVLCTQGILTCEATDYIKWAASEYALMSIAGSPFHSQINHCSRYESDLCDFGLSTGQANKYRMYRDWCTHEVDYSEFSTIATHEELDAFNIIKTMACTWNNKLILRHDEAVANAVYSDDEAKIVASMSLRGKTKYLDIYCSSSGPAKRVSINSITDIYSLRDLITEATALILGFDRYMLLRTQSLGEDLPSTTGYRLISMDRPETLFLGNKKSLRTADKTPIKGIQGDPSEIECFLAINELLLQLGESKIDLQWNSRLMGEHQGPWRDIVLDLGRGCKYKKNDVVVRLYLRNLPPTICIYDKRKPLSCELSKLEDVFNFRERILAAYHLRL